MSNQLYSGLDWQKKTHPPLDIKAATSKLRSGEKTRSFTGTAPVSLNRYDALKLESTTPCQDNMSYEVLDVGKDQEWQCWGIYDGHGGWATSEVLRQALAHYVARELKGVIGDRDSSIDSAIKAAFLRLDDEIMSNGLRAITNGGNHTEILSHLAPAVSGSCALLSMYDPASSIFRVACVGDSRAVLGRQAPDTATWTAIPLSNDQNLENQTELDRVCLAHPDEPDMINTSTGRMLGLPLTRAFGDHRWKWPVEAITKGREKYYANPPRENYKSPPYITAEPVITSTKLETGDFIILAVDGVWDNISSEDAVTCVGMWLEETRNRRKSGLADLGDLSPDYAESISVPGAGKGVMADGWGWAFDMKDFVLEERNAATHLAKNSLGGNRREQFCSVMSTLPPESRDARDDLSIYVLFFGDI